jgi:transcriptional regulator with XRE-family HTH domain
VRNKNIIGSRVREARKKSGITQLELALKLQLLGINIERSAIAKLESGRRPASDIEAASIAYILTVPLTWLFEDSKEFLKRSE